MKHFFYFPILFVLVPAAMAATSGHDFSRADQPVLTCAAAPEVTLVPGALDVEPQRLKPQEQTASAARLKPCPAGQFETAPFQELSWECIGAFDDPFLMGNPVLWEDSVVPVLWQRGRGPGFDGRPGMRRMPPPGFPRHEGAPPDAGPRGPRPPLPPPLMEKLKDLPPEEQENVIRNNERFQQLPKERQDRILRRWRRFQELPPEQKEMIFKRMQTFDRLTGEQRQKIRELFPRWRALPEDRHKALQEEFRKMRGMSPEEREKYLGSKDLENRFNAEERELLKELNTIGPLPPPPGPMRRFGRPPGSPPFDPPPGPPPEQPPSNP